MPFLGFEIVVDGPVRRYVLETKRRLESPDWRLNGMVKGSARSYKDFVVVVADPQWPRVYLLGPLLLAVALLFWGVGWMLLPGAFFSAVGVLWGRGFWSWSFRRGLRRYTKKEARLLSVMETARKMITSGNTKS